MLNRRIRGAEYAECPKTRQQRRGTFSFQHGGIGEPLTFRPSKDITSPGSDESLAPICMQPDARIVFSQSREGGIMIKNAAEWVCPQHGWASPNWLADELPRTATHGCAMDTQMRGVLHRRILLTWKGPAWDFFKSNWEAS